MAYNPFYVDPMNDYSQGLQGLSQSIASFGEARKAEEEEAKKIVYLKASKDAKRRAAEIGTPEAYAQLALEFPEVSGEFMEAMGIRDEGRAKEANNFMRSVLAANPDDRMQLYKDRVESLNELGLDSEQSAQSMMDFAEDSEAEMRKMEMIFAATDPEGYKAMVAMREAEQGGGGGKIAPVSFKDATAESLAEYERTGDPGTLVRYKGAIKDIAGIPHQYNTVSSLWEPIVDMRGEGISEQVAAAAELEAAKQSKLDFTKEVSKWQAGESKLISRIAGAKNKQDIVLTTADLIKEKINAWTTSYGSALSMLPATEARELKGLINTMKANMAFGALRDIKETGGTLGAVSAPELVLLESEAGYLDQWSTGEELKRVLDQVVKANANTLKRLDNAYAMDKRKYGSSFEEVKLDADAKAAVKAGGKALVEVTTQEAYDAMPSGTEYLEDGVQMRKP